MSPGSPEAAAPSSALGSVPAQILAKLSGMPRGGSWERAVSPRRGLDGASQSKRQPGWGWGRPDHVGPVSAEPLAQMAWLLLYIVLLPATCRLQRNRLTPECWGLRNPPGGKCSNRQEVSWSWAALLTHRDSGPLPSQSASWSSHLAGRCVWGTGPTCESKESVKGQRHLPLRIPKAHLHPAVTGPVSARHVPSGPHTFYLCSSPGAGDDFKACGQSEEHVEKMKG